MLCPALLFLSFPSPVPFSLSKRNEKMSLGEDFFKMSYNEVIINIYAWKYQ